jgi:dTMP kinase
MITPMGEVPATGRVMHLPGAEARRDRGVFLDRWWWSTVAYGWYRGLCNELSEPAFFGAIDLVWAGVRADAVFLFLETFEEDAHNTSAVIEGYRSLAASHYDLAIEVPAGPEASVTAFILDQLVRRGLV